MQNLKYIIYEIVVVLKLYFQNLMERNLHILTYSFVVINPPYINHIIIQLKHLKLVYSFQMKLFILIIFHIYDFIIIIRVKLVNQLIIILFIQFFI